MSHAAALRVFGDAKAAAISAQQALTTANVALADLAPLLADLVDPPAPTPDPGPTPPPSVDLPAIERPYSPDATWNQPLPAGVSPDEDSGRIITALTAAGVDTNVHVVPYTAINVGTDRTYTAVIGGVATTFRGPAVLRRGAPPDYGMVVVDPERLTAARFYQPSAPTSSGVISASGAGVFNIGPDNVTGRPSRGGGTGGGASSDLCLLRIGDLRRGRADHALRLHVNGTLLSGRTQPPCYKTDPAPSGGWIGSLDYGARLQLDPTLDPADYVNPQWGTGWRLLHRVIFRALQEYGAVPTDRTGSALVLAVEDHPEMQSVVGPPAGTGNYSPVIRSWDTGRRDSNGRPIMQPAIPWARLRVLAPA